MHVVAVIEGLARSPATLGAIHIFAPATCSSPSTTCSVPTISTANTGVVTCVAEFFAPGRLVYVAMCCRGGGGMWQGVMACSRG